jgi:hypothetical protein
MWQAFIFVSKFIIKKMLLFLLMYVIILGNWFINTIIKKEVMNLLLTKKNNGKNLKLKHENNYKYI